MPERETLTSILNAAAQVLGCDSAILARRTADGQFLMLSVAGTNRSAQNLHAVEGALGFAVSGMKIPLTVTQSVLVRAFREERLYISQDISEIAGGALLPEIMDAVTAIVGPRTFAVVPVIGRSGALGVLFTDKPGPAVFTAQERDVLLAYAERVGAALESEDLTSEAQRLEALESTGPPPPVVYLCQPRGALLCVEPGPGALHEALGLSEPELIFGEETRRRVAQREPVSLTVSLPGRAATADYALPSGVRVALPPPPEPPPRRLRISLRRAGEERVVAVVEDLSNSDGLRRELQLTRQHLGKVLHSVGDVILTLDAAGVVQSASEAARQVLGLPPESLTGMDVRLLAATDRGEEQLRGVLEQLRKHGYAERTLRLRRRRGGRAERFWAQVSGLLLGDDSGRPVGAVLRVQDQTERRRGDAELSRLRERLVHSERLSALGEMAARIAHEVRNPLVSIGAAAQVVAEELPADSPVREEALAITREVRRLDGIVSNFLHFARPQRQRAAGADVGRVLSEVLGMMRQKAGALQLRLGTPRGEGRGEGLIARIDPDGLKQVLWNVLRNGCDAMAHKGAGAIDCEVRQRRSGGRGILITVADEGTGVSPALRRRVFEPFFSTKARGTGLGLSICKQILEEHGGTIRLLNRPRGGTRVVIELPPAEEHGGS